MWAGLASGITSTTMGRRGGAGDMSPYNENFSWFSKNHKIHENFDPRNFALYGCY